MGGWKQLERIYFAYVETQSIPTPTWMSSWSLIPNICDSKAIDLCSTEDISESEIRIILLFWKRKTKSNSLSTNEVYVGNTKWI